MTAYHIAGAAICILGLGMLLPQLIREALAWVRRDDPSWSGWSK